MAHRRRRTIPRTAGILLLVVGLGLAPLSSGAAAAPGDVVDSGPGWIITETPDGFRIDLALDAPLPIRSAQVGLQVDGVDLGPVEVAPDGRSIRVTTADPAVRDTDSVVLTWDGAPDVQAEDGEAGNTTAPPASEVLPEDPATPGSFTVARADYDLGDEVEPLAGIPDRKGEMRGAVYYPAERTTAAPVAVFLHGRHQPCDTRVDDDVQEWPCPDGRPIPSYLGYDEPARVLASQGLVVVSISADAINALDALTFDGGLETRGQLVLDTLTRLRDANAGDAPGFAPVLQGRLDLTRVGLMGHSRGGGGVVRAARLNSALAEPFGIRSILPLAPTNSLRETAPGVATAVVLPYCDGDVVGLDGQHYVDDARGAFDDQVLRSSVLVMGANHNYFNTVWSPGGYPAGTSDDWSNVDSDQSNPVCGEDAPTRLDQSAQRAVGTAYLAGFFRLTLADEEQFLPLFDGSGATVASVGQADVRVNAQAPADDRIDLAPPGVATVTATGMQATTCTGADTAVMRGRPACSALAEDQVPHWGPAHAADTVPTMTAVSLAWSARGGTADIAFPDGRRNVSAMTDLSLSLAAGDGVVGRTDVQVEVYDGTGNVAQVDPAAVSPATGVLPGTLAPLRRVVLQQVSVPLASLTGLDLTDLRGIRIRPGTDAGGLFVADIAATRSGLGSPAVQDYPAVTLVPTGLRQFTDTRSGTVAVLLDTPAPRDVTAWIRTRVIGGLTINSTDTVQVTVPAGSRCVPSSVPVPGSDTGLMLPSMEAADFLVTRGLTTSPDVVLIVQPAEGGPEEPQVGVRGEVCAAALAPSGALDAPDAELRPGAAFTVTGSGFRSGETVTLTLPDAEAALTAVADENGDVRIEAVVPAGTAPGEKALTAVGYGSRIGATGSITVTAAAPPTSTAPSTTAPSTTAPSTTAPSTTQVTTSAGPTTSGPTTSGPTTSIQATTTSTAVATVTPSTVTAVVVPVVVTTSTRFTSTASPTRPLAHTGVDVGGLISAGVLLIGAGLTVVFTTRRRTRRAH